MVRQHPPGGGFEGQSLPLFTPFDSPFRAPFLPSFLAGVVDGVEIVVDGSHGLPVAFLVLGRKAGESRSFEEVVEVAVVQSFGPRGKCREIFHDIQELVLERITFFERLVESSDLDEDKAQPVCHALVRMFVQDGEVVDELRGIGPGGIEVPHVEVDKSEEIDGLETVVPSSGGSLCGDGEGGIIDCAFGEELLFLELDFHDELVTVVTAACDVKVSLAILFGVALVFDVDVRILCLLTKLIPARVLEVRRASVRLPSFHWRLCLRAAGRA